MGGDIAKFQYNGFFCFSRANAFKTKNTEMSEAAGEVSFGYFIEFKFGVHILL